MSHVPEQLVTQPAQLDRLVEQLAPARWIALDTEFMRERTYYARLCLVQVATPDVIACVDPLLLPSIDPLLDLLQAPTTLKVLHSSRQDLEVFWDQRKALPAPVFDTQIGAALIGLDEQIGYGNLVESITGVRLPKLHTRTDWSARPMSEAQLRYAFDDVHYLRDVYLHLERELESLGRRAWLAEECAQLTDPLLYRNDPEGAWRRLRAGQSLAPQAQVILRALAAWREREAQRRNLPRGWVVKDAVLLDIARRAPKTREELATIPELAPAILRQSAATVLAEIARSQAEPAAPLWPPIEPPDAARQQLFRDMAARVQACAARDRISATLLATRQDLQELIRSGDSPVLHGWRRTVIGDELIALRRAVLG
jgi:ribonuclease D